VGSKLSKHFQISEESDIYTRWENANSFAPNHPGKPAYYIPMPPPNITGQLHIGHSLFLTIQDTLIRFRRMQGWNTLWQPGTDHAGLATHDRIIQQLALNGITNPTRDQYDAQAAQWIESTSSTITKQIRRMGASCDWTREAYTLDTRHTKATMEAFKRCYELGLIYRKNDQWWLDISGMANDLLEAYRADEIKIIPEGDGKQLINFLENIEPWCISRQIWWGHRIPIWYDSNGKHCFALSKEEAEEQLGSNPIQDNDVLDTWFSSSLWPFAILGWPEDTPDMQTFYPANLIETADDILFFWCARMLMMGKLITGKYPFSTIYLHGLIRDKQNKKLSKSLGNGIDPLTIIDRYGCDALRFTLLENCSAGQDIHIRDQMFDSAKHFTNKMWQASRFCLMNYERIGETELPETKNIDDLAFMKSITELKIQITNALENFDFRHASNLYRNFFKHEFCDIFIERNKQRLRDNDLEAMSAFMYCLQQLLKLGHPMLPYITERIWQAFNTSQLITELW
jgi:valyl-tRNA synthetase